MLDQFHHILEKCRAMAAAESPDGKALTNRALAQKARALGASFTEQRVSSWFRGKSRPNVENLAFLLEAMGLTFVDFQRAREAVERQGTRVKNETALRVSKDYLKEKAKDPAVQEALKTLLEELADAGEVEGIAEEPKRREF